MDDRLIVDVPARLAFGPTERAMLNECLNYYERSNQDPGYQGVFEEKYCELFTGYMGGGYADVVATGTLAVFNAIQALDLGKEGEVLVSPVTDPGTLSAIIYNGLRPKLMDSMEDDWNVGAEQVEARITESVVAVLIVHVAGRACPADEIREVCDRYHLPLIEDCSQAHGASLKGKKVGSFGTIAAFSTMYRKASITGCCGGVVYTLDREINRRALAYADRGKPRWSPDFDDRDPSNYLFPALNIHANELGCAIGIASLRRLDHVLEARRKFLFVLRGQLADLSPHLSFFPEDQISPFIIPLRFHNLDSNDIRSIGELLVKAGIPANPMYKYLVRDWLWIHEYLADSFDAKNARKTRDHSIILYVNENYTEQLAVKFSEIIREIFLSYVGNDKN